MNRGQGSKGTDKFTEAFDQFCWAKLGGPAPSLELEVLQWALELRIPPTWQTIRARWNVSRATAFRWLPRLLNARENWRHLQDAGEVERAAAYREAAFR